MPCVADWLNNPFSIVQGIFGERGRPGWAAPRGSEPPGAGEGGRRAAGTVRGCPEAAGGQRAAASFSPPEVR